MEINMDGFEFFFSMQLFKVEYKILLQKKKKLNIKFKNILDI